MASIYLSPSTQEENVGYGNYGTEEERMNQLTDIIEPILRDQGYTIYRNSPSMSLREVVADSNSKNPDIHVSIHSNAFDTDTRGSEVYCDVFGTEGEELAHFIYDELEALTPTADRGVKEGANFFGPGKPLFETAYTTAPAVIIEIAFHDNPDDSVWILNNIQAIAAAIVKGINGYFRFKNQDPEIEAFKETIQINCQFDYPEGVWAAINKHPYSYELYRKWANSYIK